MSLLSGRLAALCLVGVALALAPASGTAQLRGPEVSAVRFEGNASFPADSLARAIATRATACRSLWFYFPLPLCPLGVDFALSRSTLRDRDLPRDRARLVLWYRQRGFRDVAVDTAVVEQDQWSARVMFRVNEGRPIIADSIEYLGVEAFEGEGLLDNLPIAQGDRLSTLAMDATRDSIIRRLSDNGYAYADVFRRVNRPGNPPSYDAVVTFEVVPGPATTYGDIRVEGVENLGVGTVLRTVQLRSGDPYRRAEIDEATTRLYGLEIVRNASVVPDTVVGMQDPTVDVAITVQEGDAYRVRTGGGWSTAECLNLDARWTSRNFFGGGRTLSVRGRVGNILASQFRDDLCTQSGEGKYADLTGLGAVDFVQPWIFSTRNALSATLFVERQSLPDIFVRRAFGGQIGLSRSVAQRTVLTGFYRPELSELDATDVLFCSGFLVCAPSDIKQLEEPNSLSPIGLSFTRDRSDDLLNPRSGYRILLDVEHAGRWTASDFRYDRIVAEASRYASAGRVVFAARVRGGWVGSGDFEGLADQSQADSAAVAIVHPQKRFYTGGANSVRGFAQSRLGPRVLLADPPTLLSMQPGGGMCLPSELEDRSCQADPGVPYEIQPIGGTRLLEANVELRFALGFAEGVIFTDVGQAWAQDDPNLSFETLEFAPGVGVRFASPVGPIRLDLAYRFRGAENLPVVTEAIRAFCSEADVSSNRCEEPDDPSDRIVVDGAAINWVRTEMRDLVQLMPKVLFGANDRGFQLHVSIGQAF
ncbi:MAG: BamA/TamA family outer membrane protein [Gemmatimonadota bacterium]|nr:BamA/TamA family outer membrane protein [Gemmatimonadota bacterium]MDE3012456.1 BamA/TamA family outer membrane protein [Gemmatimonadota bacterium]